MCFSNYFYSTENVQEGQGDLGWQGTDRHPDLWAGRQAHQEAGLGPGQVRVRNEGTVDAREISVNPPEEIV